MDSLILLLAQVYPLDVRMVTNLLNVPEAEAEQLLDEAKSYVFIKTLPNGQITLHDEMRSLVKKYAWPMVDADGEWRFKISNSAALYLQDQIVEYGVRIKQLKAESADIASRALTSTASLNPWREYHDCAEKIWMLKEHLLRHLLIVNTAEGQKLFISMFDDATSSYRYTPRLEWGNLVETYKDKLSLSELCQVQIRKAKALLDNGKYTEARKLLKTIPIVNLDPEQQVDTHIQLAI
jgi:hypothetical protein